MECVVFNMENKEELKIIKTLAEMEELKTYLSDKEYIAFDTETTGVQKDSLIIGMSFCAELDKAYYVIIRAWDVEAKKLNTLETEEGITDLLKVIIDKHIIMQNAVFDCWMVSNNYRLELMPSVHTDTLILGHLLNENRYNGLKERGIELFGDSAAAEQKIMKDSVIANGGVLTKANFELYKADADLIAYYGAKDALLTLKVFYHDVEDLYEQKLDRFFYEDESMRLLRGPTYDLNTTGLKVDGDKLNALKATLEAEMVEAQAFIYKEVDAYVKDMYPGTTKSNKFNITSNIQLSWLLYERLQNEFHLLTELGKELCEFLNIKKPYTNKAKREFVQIVKANFGKPWKPGKVSAKTGKTSKGTSIGEPWKYFCCDAEALEQLRIKYRWVDRLLHYKQNHKLLTTYVMNIQDRVKYGIIRPNFMQSGTTSGRYSCKNPNFQNLPRDDKRIKSCIVSRPGKVFVGADQSQLEPRCFASSSGDERLLKCFENGDDFYSVVGVEIFEKFGCSLKKDDENGFAKLYPDLRQIAKTVPLAATYGANAFRLAKITGKSQSEMEEILQKYFQNFPKVRQMMFDSHKEAITTGQVINAYGRPRRIPKARAIPALFGSMDHDKIEYEYRNLLNLAVNHKVQSTGASIMNRASIAMHDKIKENSVKDPRWAQVKIVMQVHDELILEAPEAIKDDVAALLKYCMENTVVLRGIKLQADPKIATNLADLK